MIEMAQETNLRPPQTDQEWLKALLMIVDKNLPRRLEKDVDSTVIAAAIKMANDYQEQYRKNIERLEWTKTELEKLR